MPQVKPTASQLAAYRGGLGLTGIAIVRHEPNESAILQPTRCFDPSDEMTQDFIRFDALWFRRADHTRMVLDACRADLAAKGLAHVSGWYAMPPVDLRDCVLNAASAIGARWMTSDDVTALANDAVADILAKVEAMRLNGGLAELNARYKSYRQAQIAAGEKARPYSVFLSDFTANLIALTAKNDLRIRAE